MRLPTPRLAPDTLATLKAAESRLLVATEAYADLAAAAVAALPNLDMDDQRDVVDAIAEVVTLARQVFGGDVS